MARSAQWPPRINDCRGLARIRVAGKDYYLGRAGSPEAKAEYARLVTELAGQTEVPRLLTPSSKTTVAEVLVQFKRYAERHYSKRGGQVAHFEQALSVVAELFGLLPAADFAPAQLRQMQAAMTGRGWCTHTVNRHIVRVRTAWRWLEGEKLVPAGTWAALQAVPPIRSNHPLYRPAPLRARTTDMDQVRAVCRHLPDVPRSMLLVEWWTGMRPGELCIMQAEDVDTSADVWVYRPKKHKNDWRGHIKIVPIGPRARSALAPWLAACSCATDHVFPPTPCRRREVAGRLIEFDRAAYDRSRHYRPDAYSRAIRRAADRAGLPDFFAYLCRHATRMRLSREYGDEAARAVLGQRHLETTLGYGCLDEKLARDAQRKLG